MFNFHIDEKIAIDTWNDIVNRPRYESPIDPQACRYTHIITLYSFNDHNVRCGVSDCNQIHTRGFLVTTPDDKETNLCEACGQRFFNISFEEQKKTLQKQARIRDQKIQLNTVLEQSEAIKARINELKRRPRGANWLYRSLSNFQKSYPKELLNALRELATNKEDNTIFSGLVDNDGDKFRREQIEQLQGLDIFATDIREALIGKILKPLKQLEEIAEKHGAGPNPSLAARCKWADSLEDQFAFGEYLIEEGGAFFKTENLEWLRNIPLSEKSARLTRLLRWDCDKGEVKGK